MTVAHSNELILKVLLCWYKEQIEKPGEMKRVEGEYGGSPRDALDANFRV